MTLYISLLRGINVGGYRKIKMLELKALYAYLGYKNIQSYLQSGNIVFADKKGKSSHSKKIEKAILEKFGLNVRVLVIPAETFSRIADSNPFCEMAGIDASFLHVTFLFDKPARSLPDEKMPISGQEAAIYKNGHYYLYCPHGSGSTKINNSFFERALKVPATSRNCRTVQALKNLVS